MRASRRKPAFAMGALIGVSIALFASSCTTDPTELTRTVHLTNRLADPITIQLCSNRACTEFDSSSRALRGETTGEIVQDDAVYPVRVTLERKPKAVRCMSFGPQIAEGMQIDVTARALHACP